MFGFDRILVAALAPILLWIGNSILPPLPIDRTMPIYPGVQYRRVRLEAPRSMLLHIVKIDLEQSNLELFVTPADVDQNLPARRTSSFLKEFGALVAINGGLFLPHHDKGLLDYGPRESELVTPTALAISRGVKYAKAADRYPVFCISAGRSVSLHETDCPAGTDDALAGTNWSVRHGKIAGDLNVADSKGELQPRTALALDRQAKTLWILVVDGRQLWYSRGSTRLELANFIQKELGAFDAIELDGGGSSTLVRAGMLGPSVLNSPIHNGIPGRERPVANHLGVRVLLRPLL